MSYMQKTQATTAKYNYVFASKECPKRKVDGAHSS